MSLDLVRSTTNVAENNSWYKFGFQWSLSKEATTGTKQSSQLPYPSHYVDSYSVVNLRFKQSSLNYLWNTTKCQTAGYDIPFIQSIIFILSRCLVEHYPMWICFITAGRERRSVPLDVDAGWSVFPQWRFCVDLCSAHGTSLFSIKPHGNTILTKYMLKSKIKIKFI